MGKKKFTSIAILIILIIALITTFIIRNSYAIPEDEINDASQGSFTLSVKAKPEENANKGAVELDWSSYEAENKIFKGYQARLEEGQEEENWTSISLMDYSKVKEVKVLQIYPNNISSGQLKKWMEVDADNGVKYGKGIIKVSDIDMTNFNRYPSNYLSKGSNGWNYDVIFFGTADRNGQYDLSAASKEVVRNFIKDGYGCIFGHDTILNNAIDSTDSREYAGGSVKKGQTNFDELAGEVFNSLEYRHRPDGGQYYTGGNEVQIVKNGLFTTYPWPIGEIGKKLTIPTCHSWGQIVKDGYEGNIWLRFTGYGNTGDNFYLITENNVSLIQTGHSSGQATPDEEKIIANLIFSSYQISSNTSTTDYSAMDYAPPTEPSINITQTDTNNINITFSSEDEGTTYKYKVEAYDKLNTDNMLAVSDTPAATVTSGFDKYYYVLDDQENNDFDTKAGNVKESVDGNITGSYTEYGKKYLHVKAVDKAGNISSVKTVKIIDKINPKITVEPESTEWGKEANVHLQFTDEGGSGFRGYQYALTDNREESPSMWNDEKNVNTDDISIEEGTKYLHVKAYDNDENCEEAVYGPYRVDHTNPTVEVSIDLEQITTNPLPLTITSHDDLSGIQKVKINDQDLEGTEEVRTQIEKNGSYTIKVIDIAGNEYEKSIEVNNIYQHCTAGLEHPDFSTSIETCPICDLIKGLNVTKETEIYNSQEQKVTYDNPQGATIVEYYNGNKAKPVEKGEYAYELKVEYNGVEYNTGKTGTFTISPKDITITGIEATNREYNGTDVVEIHGGQLQGVETSDLGNVRVVLPQTGNTLDKNVGHHNVSIKTITLEGERAKNYNLIQPTPEEVQVEITKKKMAGGVRVEGITTTNRKYNATNVVELHRGTLVGIEEVDNGKVDYELSSTGTTASKDVGHYNVIIPTITLTGEEAGNYEITQPAEDEVQVDITQKDITIIGITATNREYNGTDVVELHGGELVGVEDLDKEKVNFVLPSTGTTSNKNIGTYNVTIEEIKLEGEESDNYILTQPKPEEVQVEITKKKMAEGVRVEGITATSREYNATNVVELHRGTLLGIEGVDSGKVDYELSETGTTVSKDVGHYNVIIPTITLTGEEAENYEITQPKEDEVQVDITQKHITIEGITATSREYNATTEVELNRGTLVGIEEVDNEKVDYELSPTGTSASKDVGIHNVTVPEIVLTGEEAKNYTLIQPTPEEVQVEITQKHIRIEKIKAIDREYNGTNIVYLQEGELVGVEDLDKEKVNFVLPQTGTVASKNIGTYDVTIEEITLKGEEAKNYTLIQPTPEEVSVEITKKKMAGGVRVEGITATSREYNATKVIELHRGALVGIEEVDNGKVDYQLSETGTTTNKDVGHYNVIIPTITLTGEEAGNYEITQPAEDEVQVDITQKHITIEGITATNREYNATNIVDIQGGLLVGVEEIDKEEVNFVLPQTGTVANKNIGTYDVTIEEITLEGEEAKNYTLIQPTSEEVSVEITSKHIRIEGITATNRQYNAKIEVDIHRGTLVGIEEIDKNKVDYKMSEIGTIESKNVGTNNVIIPDIELIGEEAENYEIIQPAENEVKVEIMPKDINITGITAADREYNGTKVVRLSGGTLVGIEEVDDGKVEFILPITGTIDNKDIGDYNVSISEIKLKGEEAKNYNLIQPLKEDITVTIRKRKITIDKLKGKTKNYDGSDIVEMEGGVLQNIVKGEDIKAIIPETGRAESRHQGKWKVTIDEIKLEGKDIDNYEFIQPNVDDIIVEIKRALQPKLHIEPFVSTINEFSADDVQAKVKSKKVTYKNIYSNEDIRYGDIIKVTIRVFNEGSGAGYIQKVINYIPEGLRYLEDSEINKESGWVQNDKNIVETNILNFESGEQNIIQGITDKNAYYKDINLELEVIESNWVKQELEDKTVIETFDTEGKMAIVEKEDNKEENSDNNSDDKDIDVPEYEDDVPEDLERDGWEKQKGDGTNGIEEGKDIWTTDPTDPSNPDKWVDPTNPDSKIDPNTPLYPVYKKDITVTRNIYLNAHPADDPLKGTAYRSVEKDYIVPAEINLGTTSSVEIDGYNAEPRFWSISNGLDIEDEDIDENEDKVIPLNGTVKLTHDETYNMSYKYKAKIPYIKPDGTKGEAEQDVNVSSDGEKKPEETKIPEDDNKVPEDLEKDGWENEKGTGKEEPGNGIEEGKNVWTTDPTDPSDPDKWVDPTDPETEIDPNTPLYPVYKKDITVTRNIYLNSHPADDPLKGIAYRSTDNDSVVPAEINLGTGKNINIEGKVGTPKKWVTGYDETAQEVELDGTASLTQDEEYYMIYLYEVKIKVPDETGELQEIPVEIEVKPEGEKELAPDENGKRELKLPENTKKPDDNTNWALEGWTKGDNLEEDIIDLKTEIPKDGDEYHPKWSREITVERYVYPNTTKLESDLTKKIYGNDKKIEPVEINLGTAPSVEIKGKKAEPRLWSIFTDPYVEDTTANNSDRTVNEETVALEGVAHLTKDTKYYMSYTYVDSRTFTKPDGSKGTIYEEVYVNTNGDEYRKEVENSEDDIPEDLEKDGWEREKGTGKEEPGNGIKEGKNVWTTDPTDPSDPEKWIDPTDPEFNVDPETPVYPVYKKEVTATRNIYLNTHPADDPLRGVAYRSVDDDSVVPAEINLGTTEEILVGEKQGTPKRWVSNTENPDEGIEPNGTALLTKNEEYNMIYSYNVTVKVQDESGELQEQEVEVEIKPDGEKQLPKSEDGKNKGLILPEETKKPDNNYEWKLEGWTKGDDPSKEVIDPETEIPEENDEYYPKWSREIIVERYVYPEATKVESNLIGKVYGNDKNIEPAQVNLGTTDEISTDEQTATPKKWVTDIENPDEGIEPNGIVSLTENEQYYMIYSYTVRIKVPDETGTLQEMPVEIEVKPNGEKEVVTEDGEKKGLKLPENTKKPNDKDDWTLEGWNKEDDPTQEKVDLEKEIPKDGDEYHPKWSKDITVERYIYPDVTKMDQDITKKVYGNENKVIPVEVNLGTAQDINVDGNEATPKKWVTDMDNPDEGIEPNGTVSLTEDEQYYMIYSYMADTKVPDENGEDQDKKVEVEVKPNGEKEVKEGGLDLPENPKKPDEEHDWKLEGWTKGDDPTKEVIDPETEVPGKNDEYHPKWSAEITVERYIHPNTTKMEEDLTGTIYGNDVKIIPVEFNLGTTTEINLDGQTATPKKWVTDIENPDEGIEPNGTVSLTKDEQYYMIYSYEVSVKIEDETGSLQDKQLEVEVKPDGEKEVVTDGKLNLPENPKAPDDEHGWTPEGWTKGDDPSTGIIDPETEIPKNGDEYYSRWSRKITIERYIHPSTTKMEEDLTGTVYGNKKSVIPAQVNLGTTGEISIDGQSGTPKKWVTDMDSPDEGIAPNGTVSLTENEQYYMIYSYKVKVKFVGESGELEEQDVELEARADGNKQIPKTEEGTQGGIKLPEDSKKPDEDHEWTLEGWTKGDNPSTEVINPQTEIPNNGDEYHPKWSRKITIERYIHPSTTKMEEDLTGTVYGNEKSVIPAQVNLGTTEEISIDGQSGTPKKWVTDMDSPDEGIAPNGTVSLTEDEQYYMIYAYKVKVKVVIETGELKEQDVELEARADGNKQIPKTEEGTQGGIKLPEDSKKPDGEHEWKLEGWTKGDDPSTEVINPQTEIPNNGDEYHPKWSAEITVERYIHPNTTKIEQDLTGTVYGNEKSVIPAQVNLGTTEEISIDEQIATPKKWVTDIENPDEGIAPNGTASLTENEQYYMIYSYNTKIKVPDENGDLQDKDVEVEVKPDGRKEVIPKGGLDLPENPKKPDEEHEWTLEGWTKGDDPTQETIDPETEVPGNGDEYQPKWSTQITVERYIYPNTTKLEPDITKTVYGNNKKIVPVEVELKTADSVTIDGETAKPRFWSTSTAPDAEDTTASNSESTVNETAVELNGKAHLTENKKYYMSYTFTATYRYNDGTGEKTLPKELKASSDGTIVGNEFDIPDPSVLEGWTTFIGWTKDDTEPNGDLVDKETEKLDKNTLYHAVFTKEVTLTYDKNFDGTVRDIPGIQTGTVYKNDLKEVSAKFTISQQRPTRDKRKFTGWSNVAGTTMGTDYTGGEELELNENKTIYAVWNSYELGDPETYGDYVNYDVDINDDDNYSNDWKIYHYDGEYIYLILEDYLPASKLPEAAADTMRTNGDYFGWHTVPNTNLTNVGSVFMDKYLTKFNKNNTTNFNVRFLSDLLNTSNWEEFKGKFGEEVIASPTIELLMESYKRKYPDDDFSKVELTANDGGYLFDGTNQTRINRLSSDKLYSIVNTSRCNYYWIASPAPTDSSTKYKYPGIYRMEALGNISELALLNDNNMSYNGGLRPVIRLKSGTTGKQKEDDTWDLIEAPFTVPKIKLNTTEWAQQVTVTIEHDSSPEAVTEYSLTGKEGDWQTYSQPFTVNQEGKTVYARTTKDGTTLVSTLHITNIDLTPPEILSMELEGSTIKTEIRDDKSGIAGVKNKIEGVNAHETDWQDFLEDNGGKSYPRVTYSWLQYWNDGSYTLYAKDLVGNISHLTKSISNIDNTTPTFVGEVKFVPGGRVQCPKCGKMSGLVTITASAQDTISGLRGFDVNVWSDGIVTNEETGQQTSTTHNIYDQSPEDGATSGTYVQRRYFHDLQDNHTYTATFAIYDLYGNKQEIKSQKMSF